MIPDERFQRVLLATFSNALSSSNQPTSCARRVVTSTHLAPSFCEPGRVSNPTIFDCQLPIFDFENLSRRFFQSAIENRQLQRSF
jgi:hypothetical protein